MAEIDPDLLLQITPMGTELDKRRRRSVKLNQYYEGDCPFPEAVVRARMTQAYRLLMPMAAAPWGALVADSPLDRLQVTGVRSGDKEADAKIWELWQDNQMDGESKLAHNATLIDGRSFVTVWPDDETGQPEYILDNSAQMIVRYRQGSRRKRVSALRFWTESGTPYCTLYRSDSIFKFVGGKDSGRSFSGVTWAKRIVAGEDWPLENEYGVVPVVELAVNRRLKPGSFGYARGEYEHVLGLLDRINLLTFLGLIVALWLGFPLRGVIGDTILRDDDGNMIKPFDADIDAVFQLENPEAKLAEYKAADRKNLSIFDELSQLAYITKTPAHYFPMSTGISNISADTITALEGAMHAKLTDHKGSLGPGWQESNRIGGLMLPEPVVLPSRAEIMWADSQSRSMAEQADAFVKLTGGANGLPWQIAAELALSMTQDQESRWASMMANDAVRQLILGASKPAPAPAVVPAAA